MEKRPVKAVIESAVMPNRVEQLMPAARDFQAATHIRALTFGDIEAPQLVFAEEPAVKAGESPA
jgi:hypothetical protein